MPRQSQATAQVGTVDFENPAQIRQLFASAYGTFHAPHQAMKTSAVIISGVATMLALAGCSSSSEPPNTENAAPGNAGSAGNGNAGSAGNGNAGSAGNGNAGSAGNGNAGNGAGGAASVPSEAIAKVDLPQTDAATISADSLNAAVTANNAMAVDLYAHLLATLPPGNVLSSPISASLALTMTYAGAVGNTATEMATALHFDPSLGSSIFDGQNALSQALASRGSAALASAQLNARSGAQAAPNSDDYDLHVVNSVWGEQTYTWQTPFLTILAQSYGTGVYKEDFVHAFEPARLDINQWVSTQTKNKINDLLPPGALDDSTRMVLVNALHLRFPWATPFLPVQTASGTFTRGDGSTVTASFMNQTTDFSYLDDGQAQIVRIPLSNGDLSLLVALPHVGVELATYEQALTASGPALTAPQSGALVELSLPKASFTSATFSLAAAFQSMGMKSAFDRSAADFSGMCANPPNGERLYVSDIVQKATLSMQEIGVEAAAATAVSVVTVEIVTNPNPPPPPPPVPMVVNRPYLVGLVDGPTGALLMLGHIVDPTDAGGP
jgi:serpin B